MAESPWRWDAARRRYRSNTTGRFLSPDQVLSLRDEFLDARVATVRELTERLIAQQDTLRTWTLAMRAELKSTWSAEYALGRGGFAQMTPADWGRLGAELKTQYAYLQGFAADILSGTLSEAQVRARADLYTPAAVLGHEQGKASAWDVSLPAYPGDGGTPCLVNCRCSWRFIEMGKSVHATWTLTETGHGEVCDGCRERAALYSPWTHERLAQLRLLAS